MGNGADLRNRAALRRASASRCWPSPRSRSLRGIPTATPLEEIVVTRDADRPDRRIAGGERGHRARDPARGAARSCVPAKCSRSCRGWSSRSTAATARRTSTSCAASTSTTARTSRRASTAYPVNMPTHAHGQGYSDINFLIPELVDPVRYRKGTYYRRARATSPRPAPRDIVYRRRARRPARSSLTIGEDAYYRALRAASPEVGGGRLLWASTIRPRTVPGTCRRISAR